MTDFCTSTTAPEIDTPQLRATQLVAHPGTLPTITIPVAAGRFPDVDGIWRYLDEVAAFFGVPMPTAADVAAAIVALTARPGIAMVDVTIAVDDGAAQLLVTATPVPAVGAAVRITADDAMPHAHRVTDPWWRRMAARTTSRGDLDQRARWLAGRGFADCVSDGLPHLGALVFEATGDFVGVENPEPTSVLSQLHQCDVVSVPRRLDTIPDDVRRAWWVSPHYTVHPVAEFDGTPLEFDVDSALPFGRWA